MNLLHNTMFKCPNVQGMKTSVQTEVCLIEHFLPWFRTVGQYKDERSRDLWLVNWYPTWPCDFCHRTAANRPVFSGPCYRGDERGCPQGMLRTDQLLQPASRRHLGCDFSRPVSRTLCCLQYRVLVHLPADLEWLRSLPQSLSISCTGASTCRPRATAQPISVAVNIVYWSIYLQT